MIKNIEWPEGTKVTNYETPFFDYFDDDYNFTGVYYLDFNTFENSKKLAYKPFNMSQIPQISYLFEDLTPYTYIPFVVDITSLKLLEFNSGKFNFEVIFDGEELINANFKNSILSCDCVWLPIDKTYTKLPLGFAAGTKINYYGEIPVQVRVLKDGQWCDGSETVTYNFQDMNYIGNGIYELHVNTEPRGRYMFPIEVDGCRKTMQALPIAQIIILGENGDAVTTLTGENIMDVVVDNPNGWYYDAEVDGVRNNKITHSQTTRMKIEVPTNEITITYGQSSEKNYDYCIIYNGNMTKISEFKGISGDNLQITLKSDTNSFIFEYKKDTSGDNGKDAFWIKSIEYFQLPPYPEN